MSPETIASIGIVSIFILYTCIIYYAKYRDSRIWNNGICKKCGSNWAYVGGTAYGCKCKTYHFTFDWDQFRKFKYSK